MQIITDIIQFIQDYPWLIAVVGVMIALVVFARRGRVAQRDTKRMFTHAERMEASRRSGGRCEHKNPFWFRCKSPGAHGDHIYPWSRGGSTTMTNHQWLCAPHNLRKSNHIPSRLYIMRLELRRRRYFPEGIDPRVDWHIRY